MNKKALLPLIGLFLLVTGIVLPGSAHAQISEGGTPTSFKYQNTLKSDLPTVQIPINFSVEDLKTVDRWQVSQGAPLKVGVLLPTDLTIDNAGSWNTLPDGKRVWRLQVQAKDAIALMLSFRYFYIPENGKLFIYSSDKTHLIGAFTHHTNPPTKEYATEFLAGDKIILEYEAGISENEHPRIAIDAVGYGYKPFACFTYDGRYRPWHFWILYGKYQLRRGRSLANREKRCLPNDIAYWKLHLYLLRSFGKQHS